MATNLPPGPYKTVCINKNGDTAPWYIIPFDKAGTCIAPLTRRDLLQSLQTQNYTDVFIFSHGWNNDWKIATDRYENFVGGFLRMRAEYQLPARPGYKPLLVGIFWPSTALVMPWEAAPQFAASGSADQELELWRREIEELGGDVSAANREEFYGLAQKPLLNSREAKRLAEIIADVVKTYDQADREITARNDSPSADELLARVRSGAESDSVSTTGDFGFARET